MPELQVINMLFLLKFESHACTWTSSRVGVWRSNNVLLFPKSVCQCVLRTRVGTRVKVSTKGYRLVGDSVWSLDFGVGVLFNLKSCC
jgi:hypothetical protein